jgi:flagellar motor switch protein FliG
MTNAVAVQRKPQVTGSLPINQAQKAAIILCLLSKDGAGPLFEELDDASVTRFVRVMAEIGVIDGETVRQVVDEFVAGLAERGETVVCGAQTALQIVESNLGREAADRISDSIDLFAAKTVWKRIAKLNPAVVSDFIAREHPQSAAVILVNLPPEYAGLVLSELPPEQARQIAKFIRSAKGVAPKSAEIISQSVGRFLRSSGASASAPTPAARMGAIMNYATSQMRDELIAHLDEIDPEFSENVRRSMFTFADIEARVQRSDVSKVVRAVESEMLVKALAGDDAPTQSVRAFILGNIANRMAEMIAQEIKDTGAVKRKDVDKAQAEVIKAIVGLEASGEVALFTDAEE